MWMVIGLAAALTLAALTGLAVAAALEAIGRSVSELPDFERWAFGTLTRGEDSEPRSAADRLATRRVNSS